MPTMPSEPNFPCIGCGACCMAVGEIIETGKQGKGGIYQELIEDFPYQADDKGHCEKLVDGKCSIYDKRPALCRVDLFYDVALKDLMTREEYHQHTKLACMDLMKEKLNWSKKKISSSWDDQPS